MADVDAIQSWLFASVHLRGVAGASQLLVEFDAKIPGLATQFDGEALFSAGGSAVATFSSEEKASAFADEAKRSLVLQTLTARLSTSEPIRIVDPAKFGEALQTAAGSLELRKRQGHAEGELVDFPYARRCASCGIEPGRLLVVVGRDKRWLGAACALREEARDRGAWFKGLAGAGGRPFELAKDFDDLAGAAGAVHRGEIAIVAADVNGVGERLRELRTERELTEEAYHRFSEGLKRAVKRACDDSLREVIGAATKLPVELLYAGGDDLLVACQGRLALPFAKRVVLKFVELAKGAQSMAAGDDHWTGGKSLGMSAVTVLFRVGFPFRVAHDIASRLLSDAKREARTNRWEEGAVDFVRVTEAYGDPAAILADRSLVSASDKASLHLTARPFRAACTGERSLQGFETACKKLSQGFSRSKLFDLRERCSASVYARSGEPVYEKTVEDAKEHLNGFLAYWRNRLRRDPDVEGVWKDACTHLVVSSETMLWKRDGVWRTPAGDFAEGIDLWGL